MASNPYYEHTYYAEHTRPLYSAASQQPPCVLNGYNALPSSVGSLSPLPIRYTPEQPRWLQFVLGLVLGCIPLFVFLMLLFALFFSMSSHIADFLSEVLFSLIMGPLTEQTIVVILGIEVVCTLAVLLVKGWRYVGLGMLLAVLIEVPIAVLYCWLLPTLPWLLMLLVIVS